VHDRVTPLDRFLDDGSIGDVADDHVGGLDTVRPERDRDLLAPPYELAHVVPRLHERDRDPGADVARAAGDEHPHWHDRPRAGPARAMARSGLPG
jgi:hypothetical protein